MIYKPDCYKNKILKIPLHKNRIVYMFLPCIHSLYSESVVIVDPQKFKQVWGGDYSDCSPNEWMKDKNYANIEYLFMNSSKSPVKLQEIGAMKQDGKFYFVDGITRTIWLLANDASYIAFRCSTFKKNDIKLEMAAGCQIQSDMIVDAFHSMVL